ncbi:MAG: hypothetical protein MJ223_00150 [Mycoplasmoidaceae bacterium]|nr:hypothetical protein [Mycoplasmoidaceae bacterium]
MADNKEQEKQITTSIKKIKEPDFSKEVVIDKLLADKRAVDFHFNRMKKEFGDKLTDQQINERIHNLVVRDNVFNAAMHILVPCYEITIDPKHLQAMVDSLLNVDLKLKDAPEGFAKALAKNMMEKEMIFAAVAKE